MKYVIPDKIFSFRSNRRIRRQLTDVPNFTQHIRIELIDTPEPLFDFHIVRDPNTFTILLQRQNPDAVRRTMRTKFATYLYWLSLASPSIKAISVNGSDGETVSHARFTPSSRLAEQIPIADPYFFRERGFRNERAMIPSTPSWQERSDVLTWRGGLNGNGWQSYHRVDRFNATISQRLRMVMILENEAMTDVKLISNGDPSSTIHRECTLADAFGQPIPQPTWLNHKYAIDIDGFTNTWSNLLVRLLFGCCVLKIESQFGYRQWYYDDLNPWEHYVPVKADMSDLLEKIEWVRSNDHEAAQIAARGQQFALGLTFESQARRSAEIIEQYA